MRKPLFKTLLCLSLLVPFTGNGQDKNALEAGFMNPAEKVQTSVYWYWISGNISEEGVKKDLYSMKEAGINRAFIGNIGLEGIHTPYKTVPFYSEEWWKILHAALKTATELGIEIGIFNSPGWSQSGGPWVKPEQAMRYLASVKAEVSGGKQVEVVVAKPDKDFQDVRVIAFPSVEKKATRLSAANAKVTSAMSLQNLNSLIDGDKETAVLFTEKSEKPVAIDFRTDQPFTLRSLQIFPARQPIQTNARLLVKENGGYRMLSEFKIDRFNANLNVGFDPYAPVVISVPETTASEFRLELANTASGMGLGEVEFLSLPAVERYPEKTLAKMFQNLRKGSLVYVFDNREQPKFYTANVKDVSAPYFPPQKPGQFSPMPQFINISIEGNEPWGVPMQADIVSKDGLTVATTREVLKPTIMEAQQASRDIVESFDRHKANLKVYDEILMQLDPEAARSKELEAENRELRKMLADMNERLSQIPTAEELRSLVKSEPPAKTK